MTPSEHDLYIFPHGNDVWSGRLPEPDESGRDGPLATLAAARERIRRLKQAGELSV